MNVAAAFDQQARRAPRAPALSWDGGLMSHGELRDRAHRLAHLLRARGVARGDRVALLLPNDPAFAIALLGVFWVGATAAVLSPAWAAADASRALAMADARLLVTTRALGDAVGADDRTALAIDALPGAPTLGEHLARRSIGRWVYPLAVDAADAACILFSSGTTGDPKGVVLTHANLLFNARSKVRYCGIRSDDRLALAVPVSHCFGQNVVLLGALLGGASVRIHPRFEAARVAHDIRRGEVSMLLAAPTAFSRLLALDDDAVPRRLRYALSAAAPLPAELAARWREAAGRPLAQGYGLTECSPFATYDDGAGAAGTAGRAIDGVRVRIASLDGERWLAPGESGEVAVAGPNVMRGYWRRPDATARALRGGWLSTGDLGTLDDGGTLRLADRVDDVINVAGFKAWPSDVERAVARHPAVLESAAYGVPDADRGARVAVAVVLRHGCRVTPDAILACAARHLAGFQRPAFVSIVEALPRSAAGKVLRRSLPHAAPPVTAAR